LVPSKQGRTCPHYGLSFSLFSFCSQAVSFPFRAECDRKGIIAVPPFLKLAFPPFPLFDFGLVLFSCARFFFPNCLAETNYRAIGLCACFLRPVSFDFPQRIRTIFRSMIYSPNSIFFSGGTFPAGTLFFLNLPPQTVRGLHTRNVACSHSLPTHLYFSPAVW